MIFKALQRQVEAIQAVKYQDQIGQRQKPHSAIQVLYQICSDLHQKQPDFPSLLIQSL